MSRKHKRLPEQTPASPEAPPVSAPPAEPQIPVPTPTAAPAPERATRRDLLARAGTAALAACGLGAVVGAVRFAMPETADGTPRRFALGTPADFKMRTVTWLRDRELFVVRDDKGFGAFSSRCTHLGCTVQRTAEGFACPCHGARYDAQGAVVSGPARRSLPWFALWQEADGQVWVDVSRAAPTGTIALAPPGAGP